MRKLTISLLSAAPALLAATVLLACTGEDDQATDLRTVERPTTTSTTSTSTPTTTPPAERSDAPPPASDPVHYVCPDGGMEEVIATQNAVDEGHQPWWLSAPDVAAACTFGIPDSSVEPAGTNTYRVTQLTTGETAVVEVAQPLGPDGIWVVTQVTL